MKQITTYVGIDAHKKDLFIAMLVGMDKTPVTWTVPNEPNAVRRLCGSSSEKRAGGCRHVTRPARAAMRCSAG